MKEKTRIRSMEITDYEAVFALWESIRGLGIRSIDDSKEGVRAFLKRNPKTSVVAQLGDEIVGNILCGFDGRRACLYHVCVSLNYRKQGIAQEMLVHVLESLKEEGINKACLVAFRENELGNDFWQKAGWTLRDDLNYYDYIINEDNQTEFVK